MDPKEIGWEDIDWTDQAQERAKWSAPLEMVIVLWSYEMQGISCVAVSFSRRTLLSEVGWSVS